MVVEYFSSFLSGIVDIFTQGGLITYIILFIGIYGLLIAMLLLFVKPLVG